MIDGVTRATTCQMLYGAAVNCITYYCQFNTRANFMIPYDRIPSCRFTLHFTPIYTSTRRHVLQVCERHRSHKVFVSRVQTLAQSAKNEMAQICTGTGKHRHYLNIFRAVKASEMVKSLAATKATLHPILSERSFCSNRCTQSWKTAVTVLLTHLIEDIEMPSRYACSLHKGNSGKAGIISWPCIMSSKLLGLQMFIVLRSSCF